VDVNGERRDYVQYLSQGDNDAGAGELLVLERKADPFQTPPEFPFRSPLSRLKTGDLAKGSLMRDLCAGKDPDTGAVVLKGKKNKGVVKPAGGFDCQIGVVKSVSLAAVFDAKRSAGIRVAEKDAYTEAMQWAFDKGLFATRVTVDGKTFHEPARRMVMAVYTHATSRAEDPHDHHHGAIMAMCERQDGTLGTMSNFLLMRYGGAINAYKKCAEAAKLKELGLAVERDPENPRAYRLAGVEPRLVELFSKRRDMIEKAARKAGIDTAKDRLSAQFIAYDTREDKRFTEAETLEVRWDNELKAAGYSREDFVFAIEHAAREAAKAEPEETDAERQARLSGLVMTALGDLQRDSAAFSRARLYQTAFEALQCEVRSGEEAAELVTALEQRGELVLLADRGGEPIYTTTEMIEMEKATLRTAWAGKGKGPRIDPATIEAVLKRVNAELRAKYGPDAGIKPEQEKAVRHALGGDQFTNTQGYAGTGKSFITALQREIVEAQGYKVFGAAPSWKATAVLKTDSGLKPENCVVLAKLLYDYRQAKQKGETIFDASSFIILDEAGMVSARDMSELVQIAAETGASLRLQGDKGQFRAMDAGQPFAAMQRLLGAAELRDIQRQKIEWMRAASVALDDANNSSEEKDAAYRIRQALQVYDDKARIAWVETEAEAFAAAVEKVMEWRTTHPNDSCAVVTEWNSNARAASELLRARLREVGQIDTLDTPLRVIVRGSKENTKGATLAFSRGDEVIFGENVKLEGRTIRNNDLARITALDASDPENPRFAFRFDDGQEVEATYKELVGRREEGELAAPRMQHSYVMTGHSSQGATYARTVDLTLEGHGREATLVASTRHKTDHYKVVVTERLADKIESKKATILALSNGGRIAKTRENDAAAEARAELEEIKLAYYAECAGQDSFGNVSDFYPDIHAFAGVEKPAPKRAAGVPPPIPAALVKARIEGILKAEEGRPARFTARPANGPAAAPPARQPTASKLRIDPLEYKGRVTESEVEQFKRTPLLDFAVQHLGAKALAAKPQDTGPILLKNEEIGIGINPKTGDYFWSLRPGGEGGNIVNLVQKALGKDFISTLHWLRQALGAYRPDAAKVEALRDQKPSPERVAGLESRRTQIQHWFDNLKNNGVSRWLVERRGISADVIARFPSSIRGETTNEFRKDGVTRTANCHGAAFAHFDGDLNLTTIARRGPEGFSRYAEGGARGLFQAGDLSAPERAYITATSIDTLSVYQFDGQPRRAALLASDGSLSDAAREIIVRRAREWPGAVWHVGKDSDDLKSVRAAGEGFTDSHRYPEDVIAAIREGNSTAEIVMRDPGDDYHDWNDRIRGPEFTKAAVASRRAAEEAARASASTSVRILRIARGPKFTP
jgi:conjugative relaxase-like TrwC/TraI family protein